MHFSGKKKSLYIDSMLYLAHAIGLCRGFFSVGPKSGCGLRLMNVELFGFDGGTRWKHWWWLRCLCQYKRRGLGSSGEWTSRMLKLVSQYASSFRRLNVIKGTTRLVMSRNYGRWEGRTRYATYHPTSTCIFFCFGWTAPVFYRGAKHQPPEQVAPAWMDGNTEKATIVQATWWNTLLFPCLYY